MQRRDFLKTAGAVGAQALLGYVMVTPAFLPKAIAETGLPLEKLRLAIGAGGDVFVRGDQYFQDNNKIENLCIVSDPQVLVRAKSAEGIAASINWARENRVPFAIRAGGHCYEDYSCSPGLVIDVRPRETGKAVVPVKINPNNTVEVDAGIRLGELYEALAAKGLVFPAGTCGSVGLAGHSLGGGYGLLARRYGLACDNILEMEVINAQGQILTVNATSHSDLFWALRGGGNGQFGIVTRFKLQAHPLVNVSTARLHWVVNSDVALKLMNAWQTWLPSSPREITSLFTVAKFNSQISVTFLAQSTGALMALESEARVLTSVQAAKTTKFQNVRFLDAAIPLDGGVGDHNVGGEAFKAKSDYLFQPMSDKGIQTLIDHVAQTGVTAICDSYGGAIADVANDATAFAHRQGAIYSIQYYTGVPDLKHKDQVLTRIRSIYAAMRPYVSGACYVNYCDLDIQDYEKAYWGENVARLKQVKAAYDPDNFFRHSQSITLA